MYKDLNNIIVIFSTFENYLYRLFYVIMDDFSCELVFLVNGDLEREMKLVLFQYF